MSRAGGITRSGGIARSGGMSRSGGISRGGMSRGGGNSRSSGFSRSGIARMGGSTRSDGISRGSGGVKRGSGGVKRGGGGVKRGSGGVKRDGGGVKRGGGGVVLGGGGVSRGRGPDSRGTGISRRGGISGGTHQRGGLAHGRKGGHRHGHGHGHSHFYLGHYGWPYWYGYGYPYPGFGISVGIPLYDYYDDYRAVYPANYVDDYGVVDTTPESLTTSATPSVVPASGRAVEYQLQAEQAFREHRYEDAVQLSQHAVVEDGQNGLLHLFASQTLFALGDFRLAAAAIQRGCALLDRDDWGFVVENFRELYRGKDYVTQMEVLVEFIKQNPDASYAYFLCGYHYKFLGYDKAARIRLSKAVELESKDRLAAELLAMTGGEESGTTEPIPPPDEDSEDPGSTSQDSPTTEEP